MARPSIQATPAGIQMARQELKKRGLTQIELGRVCGCSRQPIVNFLQGKSIAQSLFIRICAHLGLDWRAVAGLSPNSGISPRDEALNYQAQVLRRKVYAQIQEQCGTMRVLDMSHPIDLDNLYTDVNILEKITGRRRKEIAELLSNFTVEEFERFGFGKITEQRVPALDAVEQYRKLIILGKPGAGKTTFLKHLAIQCSQGHFLGDHVPIFVTLKDFAEVPNHPSLVDYIQHQLEISDGLESQDEPIRRLLYEALELGKVLILLDGLDEVRREDNDRILRDIRDFSNRFYKNQWILTCRIAAREYTFETFAEVEIADFDERQIAVFVKHWFQDKAVHPDVFLQHLNQNDRILELATNPLLLTLLCLTFEELMHFPRVRSELYREGLDALLKKWDAKRGIYRNYPTDLPQNNIYKQLSIQRKQDLLSQIALKSFCEGIYFFKKSAVEQYITDYLRLLPNIDLDQTALQMDSEVTLRSIEAQHGLLVERAKGIYSFSHLTFHEYFTARELVLGNHHLEQSYLTDRRWREVLLLATELLRDAAKLLIPMKQAIDNLFLDYPKLQAFLVKVDKRAKALQFNNCKASAIRAFYFDVDIEIDKDRKLSLRLDQTANYLVCASFLSRMIDKVSLSQALQMAQDYDQQTSAKLPKIHSAACGNRAMIIAMRIALSQDLDSSVQLQVAQLLDRISTQNKDSEQAIADEARMAAKNRYLMEQEGTNFTPKEKVMMKTYYDANLLLIDCLRSEGCMMDPHLRQQLEEDLLLPPRGVDEALI